jgi:hypothetical protein
VEAAHPVTSASPSTTGTSSHSARVRTLVLLQGPHEGSMLIPSRCVFQPELGERYLVGGRQTLHPRVSANALRTIGPQTGFGKDPFQVADRDPSARRHFWRSPCRGQPTPQPHLVEARAADSFRVPGSLARGCCCSSGCERARRDLPVSTGRMLGLRAPAMSNRLCSLRFRVSIGLCNTPFRRHILGVAPCKCAFDLRFSFHGRD